MHIYWLKIKNIINETIEVKTFHLEKPDDFTWEEGSFTHIGLKGFNEGNEPQRHLVRHMSINNLPEENTIGFTTRIKKDCSQYKTKLSELNIGDEVALFRTHCNVPLKRDNKNIYLLSAGVGLATFKPLVETYFKNQHRIKQLYSLNIDSTDDFLFTNVFKSDSGRNFVAEFVNNRDNYYETVSKLAKDQEGIFYIVGSDEFLMQNIEVLRNKGIDPEQIMLDKRENVREQFFTPAETV